MSMIVETSVDMQLRRRELLDLALSSGDKLRALYQKELIRYGKQASADEAMVGFNFGHKTYSFNVQGELVEQSRVGLAPSLRVAKPGSVHGNFMLQELTPIPCGVVLVVGAADTAKTPLALSLAASQGMYQHIRHGEPLAGYASSEEDLARDLFFAVASYPEIATVVLDSLKDQLITAPGGAMTSGLSRGIWPALSNLSSVFSDIGKSLIIPINPATVTEGVLDMVIESAKSNVAMVIASEGEGLWATTTRQGEGLRRVNTRIKTSFLPEEGGLVFAKAGVTKTSTKSGNKHGDMATIGTISQNDFDAVLRRNFSHMGRK